MAGTGAGSAVGSGAAGRWARKELPPPRTVWDDLPLAPPVCPQTEPELTAHVWTVGKLTVRADFDSANLSNVKVCSDSCDALFPQSLWRANLTVAELELQVGSSESHLELWTRPDNAGTGYATPLLHHKQRHVPRKFPP